MGLNRAHWLAILREEIDVIEDPNHSAAKHHRGQNDI